MLGVPVIPEAQSGPMCTEGRRMLRVMPPRFPHPQPKRPASLVFFPIAHPGLKKTPNPCVQEVPCKHYLLAPHCYGHSLQIPILKGKAGFSWTAAQVTKLCKMMGPDPHWRGVGQSSHCVKRDFQDIFAPVMVIPTQTFSKGPCCLS